MDPRRFLIIALCAVNAWPGLSLAAGAPARTDAALNRPTEAPARAGRSAGSGQAPSSALAAIAAANIKSRQTSNAADFKGGVQVFAYSPGRIYEVWTAPLRVTALTLAPGERIVAIAAGDTVRWQIGQTTSGGGGAERAHVMIKPMERGLETNLVLTTSARVYLLQLKSGAPETFNAAVAWDVGEVAPPPILANVQGRAQGGTKVQGAKPGGLVSPAGPLDARYKIQTGRRAPIWAPTMIMTDGVRTFLRFPDALAAHEAPALFMLGPDGEPQLLNYRQQGGLWIVDRVLDQAELRLGAGRSEVVKIVRVGDRS